MKYFVFSIKLIIIVALFGILNTRYQIPNTVFAEGTRLKIKPTVLQIKATSPGDIHAPFRIQNLGDETISLKIILKRFRDAGDESGKIVYSTPESATKTDDDPFLKQIQVLVDGETSDTVTLGPQQEKELELFIMTEDGTVSQDQYFSIIFLNSQAGIPTRTEAEAKDASFSSIQAGIALPVLLSLNADTKATGFIDSFEAPIALQNGPVPFTVRVKNTGEHFIQAQGLILIKNMFGQTVGRVSLPQANILAGSTRLLPSDLSETDRKARWSEKLLFGFYTATLSIALSPEQSLYTRSVHFITFPFSLLSGLLFISVVAFLIFHRIRKKVSEE